MTKVKIKPIIERDELGRVNLPIARFRVIEETEAGLSGEREASVVDLGTTEGRILGKIQSHSITPTTLSSRYFGGGYNDAWFTDTYAHNGKEVLRFGINVFCDRLQASADGLVDRFSIVDYTASPIPVCIINNEAQSSRSGSTKRSDQYTTENAQNVRLSQIEGSLLNKAMDYLLEEPGRRTVAVDIFARGRSASNLGYVQIKDGLLETHTVLLYKNPSETGAKSKIMVIDPNNFTYSSHLANFNIDSMNAHQADVDLVTSHQTIQIYTPVGVPGPLPNQYRNCVDIVVKLARGIDKLNEENRAQGNAEVDLLIENRGMNKKLSECHAIKNVSNSVDIDRAIIVADLPVRIKQSSDLKEVQIFNDLERVIKNKYKTICKLTNEIGANQEASIYKAILLDHNRSGDCGIFYKLFEHNDLCNERIKMECDMLQQGSTHYDLALMADARDGGYII